MFDFMALISTGAGRGGGGGGGGGGDVWRIKHMKSVP